ncbi:MAG: hypothetical protein ACUVWZ_14780 [Anaerolineae bacterium]
MKRILIAFLGLLLVGFVVSVQAQTVPTPTRPPGKPVVRFYLFYSDTCPHCHEIMENYLPTLFAKYGDRLEHQTFNIHNNTDNYQIMLGLEIKLGVPEEERGYIPALVIGEHVLIGSKEISEQLEPYVVEYLAQGGVDYPSLGDLPAVTVPTAVPRVQLLVFLDQTHKDFERLNALIGSLIRKYGDRLQALAVDIRQSENASRLNQLNEALGVGTVPAGTPEVLIDRQLLVGIDEIEAQLPGLIDSFLAQGGVSIPPWEELIQGRSGATPTAEGTEPVAKPIYLAYFEQAGCQECARTTYDLQLVQEQYPQLVVESYSIEDRDSKALNEWLSEKYGVPEEKRLSTPMIFVGKDVLIGSEANLSRLLSVVGRYASTGAERVWDQFDPAQAEQRLLERFRSFGVLTVLGAGLIDGLNPCAFATLVFFISYLTFTGRRGREILLVGLSFALGVFLTYLLVGVGLLRAIQSLPFFASVGRWVYLITALLCVILAAFTFRDYIRARRGKASDMTLKLPMALRRKIHRVIREGAQVRAFVVIALVTGFVVSLLELACTGQVYLPTILFVLSVPHLAARAFSYLILYCVMFILPLIIVFVLSYLGTTSEQLGRLVNRHTATVKFLTGLLFVGLALWMTWTLAPLFSVSAPWHWILLGGVVAVIALGVAGLQVAGQRMETRPAGRQRRSRA